MSVRVAPWRHEASSKSAASYAHTGILRRLWSGPDNGVKDVALIRIEQLYPFPVDEYAVLLKQYDHVDEVIWCQEEPQNQGAWYQSMHNLLAHMQDEQTLYYTGRPSSASPAVGYYSVHVEEQLALVKDAITVGAGIKL